MRMLSGNGVFQVDLDLIITLSVTQFRATLLRRSALEADICRLGQQNRLAKNGSLIQHQKPFTFSSLLIVPPSFASLIVDK
jgi:hypothetical protein